MVRSWIDRAFLLMLALLGLAVLAAVGLMALARRWRPMAHGPEPSTA